MTVPSRTRVAAASLLLVPGLTACSLTFDAPTDQVYTPSRGSNERSGVVDVLGAVVVSGADGSGTVAATLVNGDDQPDRLTGVTVDGQAAQITTSPRATELKAIGVNNLAASGAVTVESDAIVGGDFVELAFSFERGDPVTLDAPVVRNTGDFADVVVPQAG